VKISQKSSGQSDFGRWVWVSKMSFLLYSNFFKLIKYELWKICFSWVLGSPLASLLFDKPAINHCGNLKNVRKWKFHINLKQEWRPHTWIMNVSFQCTLGKFNSVFFCYCFCSYLGNISFWSYITLVQKV
jgi:hypothetical protein